MNWVDRLQILLLGVFLGLLIFMIVNNAKWPYKIKSWKPDFEWKWLKWTFGFWSDPDNHTLFGIDLGPLEIVWRFEGYRP